MTNAIPTMTARRYSELLLRRSRGEVVDDLELLLLLRGRTDEQFQSDVADAADCVRIEQLDARLTRLMATVEHLAIVAQHLLTVALTKNTPGGL